MEALRIEILDRKALKIIKDLEKEQLIKVTKEPLSTAQAYLEKMRRNADTAPSLEEITEIVEEVRAERYAKNKNIHL